MGVNEQHLGLFTSSSTIFFQFSCFFHHFHTKNQDILDSFSILSINFPKCSAFFHHCHSFNFQHFSCFVIFLFISQRFPTFFKNPNFSKTTTHHNFSTKCSLGPSEVQVHWTLKPFSQLQRLMVTIFPPFSHHFPSFFPLFPAAFSGPSPRHLQGLAAGFAQRERAGRCTARRLEPNRSVFGVSRFHPVGLPWDVVFPWKMVVSWDGYHEINGDLMVIYPLVNIHKAIENGDLVRGFSHEKRDDFP